MCNSKLLKSTHRHLTAPIGRNACVRQCMQTHFCSRGARILPASRVAGLILCDASVTAGKKRSSSSKKDRTPPLPSAQDYQQTVASSFTLGGIGLHTGEYAFVRVRPALAGEGRYFVRVPAGTNAHDYNLEAPDFVPESQLDVRAGAVDGLTDDARAQLYLRFLKEQERGQFEGNFGDFIREEVGDPSDTFFLDVATLREPENPIPRDTNEIWVPASIEMSESCGDVATVLCSADGQLEVLSPEALLAALEQCGVDNARIEIEVGGASVGSDGQSVGFSAPAQLEIPVVDGSALGWVLEVQKVGLSQAISVSGGEEMVPRMAPAPAEMLTVQDGEAFVTFYPGSLPRVTAGVDETDEAAVIGRQWFTWTPCNTNEMEIEHTHFRWEVSPARLTMTLPAAERMLSAGLLRGGPDYCCIVADGDSLLDPSLERFPAEEASRNAVARLLGNLAMLAPPGGRGMPQGHVVAYRAGTELQLRFGKALAAQAKEWAMAAVKQ